MNPEKQASFVNEFEGYDNFTINCITREIKWNNTLRKIIIEGNESNEKDIYNLLTKFSQTFSEYFIGPESSFLHNSKLFFKYETKNCIFLSPEVVEFISGFSSLAVKLFKEMVEIVFIMFVLNENFSAFDSRLFVLKGDNQSLQMPNLKYIYYRKLTSSY
jgi:hypothetical protein